MLGLSELYQVLGGFHLFNSTLKNLGLFFLPKSMVWIIFWGLFFQYLASILFLGFGQFLRCLSNWLICLNLK